MLELQNCFKMKDFFAENFGNFAKDFGNFCFRKNNVDLPPSPTFSGKIFAFRKNFFGGALEWKGAKILEYTPPPTGNRLARPWF